MTPTQGWRTLAIVAMLGWAGTALGWWMSSDAVAPPEPAEVRRAIRADPPEARRREPRSGPPMRSPARVAPPGGASPERAALEEEVRREVLAELELERAERRALQGEEHLGRLLDDVDAFAVEHGLDGDTRSALESATVTLHERLEALRPPGPPGPDGPPPEAMDAIEASFDQFRAEVAESVDDVDLAAAFTERMTPRPLRDRVRD